MEYDVVAVLKKTVKRMLTDKEAEYVVQWAKKGLKEVILRKDSMVFSVTPWVRTITADNVPVVIRTVRKTLGPAAEILFLEPVKEANLVDAQG